MSSAFSTCAKCGGACCKNGETYLTGGDVERITGHTGRSDFHVMKTMGPRYAGCDPAWTELVCGHDGHRRVLHRSDDGECTFLAETGCVLPLDVRPLLCRIYPYEFDGAKLLATEPLCPISRLPDRASVLVGLGMPPESVRQWRRDLYAEISREKVAAAAHRS